MAKTATNPETGETVEWNGSSWVPQVAAPQTADLDPMVLEQGPTTDRPITDIPLGLAQGITGGYMDEIGALLKSSITDKTYEQSLIETRERMSEIPTESAVPMELAGGLTTALVASPYVAATKVGQMFTKLPGWLQSTGLGGMWASLYNSGHAEEDKLQAAGEGLAIGSLLGLGGHGTVKAVKGLYGGASRYLQGISNPELAAAKKLAQKITDDGLTLDRLRGRMNFLGPQATIADAGRDNIVGLVRGAAGLQGPAKTRITTMTRMRSETEGARISGSVKIHLGAGDYFVAEEQLLSKLSQAAQQSYKIAYENNPYVTSKALDRMLAHPTMKAAVKEAALIANTERAADGAQNWLGPIDRELTALFKEAGKAPKEGVARGLSLETLDYVKRGFEVILDRPAMRNELTSKLTKKGKANWKLLNAYRNELDKQTGGKQSLYKKARAEYESDAQVIEALRDGAEFNKLSPHQISKRLGELSEAGKAAYRNGAARAVMDIVENTPDRASAARRLFGTSMKRQKIQALFPDREGFADFSRLMAQEQRFSDVTNTLQSGGRSAAMGDEISDVRGLVGNVGAIAGTKVPGTHSLVMSGIVRKMAQKLVGPQHEAKNAIARMTVSKDPVINAETFRLLEPYIEGDMELLILLRQALFPVAAQVGAKINN